MERERDEQSGSISEIWSAKYFIRDRDDHSSYCIRGTRDLFTLSLPLALSFPSVLLFSPFLSPSLRLYVTRFLSTFSRVFLCWRRLHERAGDGHRERRERRKEWYTHKNGTAEPQREREGERERKRRRERDSGTHPSIKRRADSGLSFGLRSPHDSFFDNHSLSCSRGFRGDRRPRGGDRRRRGGTRRDDGGNLQAGKYRSVVDRPVQSRLVCQWAKKCDVYPISYQQHSILLRYYSVNNRWNVRITP